MEINKRERSNETLRNKRTSEQMDKRIRTKDGTMNAMDLTNNQPQPCMTRAYVLKIVTINSTTSTSYSMIFPKYRRADTTTLVYRSHSQYTYTIDYRLYFSKQN